MSAWWLDREAAIERNRHAHESDQPERNDDEGALCSQCGGPMDANGYCPECDCPVCQLPFCECDEGDDSEGGTP